MEDRRQLPAEVDRVLQTEVEARSADRRVDVRGIADQHHPADPVLRRDPRVDAGKPAQIQGRVRHDGPQRHVRAEHPLGAGLQLGQAHRRLVEVVVAALFASRGVHLIRHHRQPASHRAAGENAVLGSMEPQGRKRIGPVRIRRGADRVHPFVRRHHVESHSDHQVIRRHAGEVDAREVACPAGAAVGADEVLGGQIVRAVRPGDMHRHGVVVLVETRQGMTPTNVCVVFAGPLGKHQDEALLLYGDGEQLGVRHRLRDPAETPRTSSVERVSADPRSR